MDSLGLYVASSALIKYVIYYKASHIRSGIPANAQKVGTVKSVFMFPLKSGAGVSLKTPAQCTDYGLLNQQCMDRYVNTNSTLQQRILAM